MLYYAIVFFIIALLAALVGFGSVSGLAMTIAQILIFVFLVLFIIGLVTGRGPRV